MTFEVGGQKAVKNAVTVSALSTINTLGTLSTLLISSYTLAAPESAVEPDSYLSEPPIVVTASSTQHKETTAPASISVIPGEDIRLNYSGNLVRALRQSVGMNTSSQGIGGRQTLGLRGMDGKYVLMLVNGRRVNASDTLIRANDFDVSTIPVDSIERVEVVRGPMSSLYGSDALGGVINIITKAPNNALKGSFSYDYLPMDGDQGGEEQRLGGYFSTPLMQDKAYWTLSVDAREREAWTPYEDKNNTPLNESEVNALENKDVLNMSSAVQWNLDPSQQLVFEAAYNQDQRKSLYHLKDKLTLADQDIERQTFSLSHLGQWQWGDTKLRAFSEEAKVYDGIDRPDIGLIPGRIRQNNLGVEASISSEIGDHWLTVGTEASTTEVKNKRELLSGKADNEKYAAFAQDEWSLTEQLTSTFGVRVDKHSSFGSHVSPRGYLVYELTPEWTLKGGIGSAYKTPSVAQITEDFRILSCGGNCYLSGNPDLKPEVATSYEFSVLFKPEDFSLGLTYFRNDIRDLIDNPMNAQGNREWVNVNKARVEGVESTLEYAFTSELSTQLNYTFTDARDRSKGVNHNKLLIHRPRQNFNLLVDWAPLDRVSGFVRLNYVGEQKTRGRQNLKGYHLIDVGTHAKVYQDVSFRVGVNNIADVRLNELDEQFDYIEAGRTYYVGMTLGF